MQHSRKRQKQARAAAQPNTLASAPAAAATSASTSKSALRAAQATLWLASSWVLAVALIKLLRGSPGDLPVPVQQTFEALDLGLKFQLVLAVELSVVVWAVCAPRWGWRLLSGLLALFLGLLGWMIARGDSSCGCFGGALSVSPWLMLAIDAACLAALLATRPWSAFAAQPVRAIVLLPAWLLALAAPFVFFRNEQLPEPPRSAPLAEAAAEPAAVTPAAGAAPALEPPVPALEPSVPALEPSVPALEPWHLPDPLPQFQTLSPRKQAWQGKRLLDTQLAGLMDVSRYNQNATWILYRLTCSHCAQEFKDIAADPLRAIKPYVLVRIPGTDDELNRRVKQYPPIYDEALLPELTRGYIGLTPWMLEVEQGTVAKVIAGKGVE